MEKYQPPYEISDDMVLKISSITGKLDRVDAGALLSQPHLRRINRIRSVHSSLRIEANSLSPEQVSDIINGKVVLGERAEIQAVKNAYAAYERLGEIEPCSADCLLRFHAIMMNCLTDDAGMYRRGEEGVFRDGRCIFMAPPAARVPQLMDELLDWLRDARDSVHPLIAGSVFHYEFVFIHPFSDGNGRMARLWHTALLSRWKPVFAYIPLESQIEKFQAEYYDAIARCHAEGASTTFIRFMLARIDGVLDEILATGTVPERARRLLAVMPPGVALSARELMQKLGLSSREGFRRNYLRPAIEAGLIQMTDPAHPNSSRQRYIALCYSC